MLSEIDPQKIILEILGTQNIGLFGFSRNTRSTVKSLSPIRQQVKRGSNTKVRSTYHYYWTNLTNKQSTNKTNQFLIGLLGQVSGLGYDLLGFQ